MFGIVLYLCFGFPLMFIVGLSFNSILKLDMLGCINFLENFACSWNLVCNRA